MTAPAKERGREKPALSDYVWARARILLNLTQQAGVQVLDACNGAHQSDAISRRAMKPWS